ncbi:CoA transferase [Streptomyces sp. NPDC088810]|uniref:CoA transferase n=1 Tax=Streptomyces sp. NPDC088810 TaxID=3365904 RepID=UPI0038121358
MATSVPAELFEQRQPQRRDFFLAADRADLAADPRVNGDSIADDDVDALMEPVGECSSSLTTEEWTRVCAKHSIPMAPVLELDRAAEDPYVRGGGLVDVVHHPSEGAIRSVGVPVRFSATPASVRRFAPLPGQHTEEVFQELAAGR